MYLAALIPPNNAETALLSLKRNIFYKSSVVSAWALRPMVPFAFYTDKPALPGRKALPAVPPEGLLFGDRADLRGQCCIVSAECSLICTEIIDVLSGTGGEGCRPVEAEGITGGIPGIHLCDLAERGAGDAAALGLSLFGALPPEQKRWGSCTLRLFKAQLGEVHWWDRLVLETIEEVRLRAVSL